MAGKFSLEIESKHGSLADAVKAMKDYENAAEGADAANDKLGASAPKAGDGLRKTGQAAGEAEKAVGRLSKKFIEAGGSAGQFKAGVGNATQQLFDVLVTLQGGMNPLTVLIQQGPQLATSFGSISATMGVLLSVINPLTIGLTAAGAAVAYLGYQAYDNSRQIKEYGQSLAQMGDQAGISAEQLKGMADRLAASADIDSSAAEKAAVAAATRLKTQEQIQQVMQVTADTIKNTGEAADDVASRLAKAYSDPLTFMKQMNDTLGDINPALYEQINKLVQSGNSADAARILLDTYDATQKSIGANAGKMADQQVTAWDRIKAAIMGAKQTQDDFNQNVEASKDVIQAQPVTGFAPLDLANKEAARKDTKHIQDMMIGDLLDFNKKVAAEEKKRNAEATTYADQLKKTHESTELRSVKLLEQRKTLADGFAKNQERLTVTQRQQYKETVEGLNREIAAAQKAEAGHEKKDKAAASAARATAKNAQEEIGANTRLLDMQAQLKDAVEGRLKVTNEERAAAHNRNLISEYEVANAKGLLSIEQQRALTSMKSNQAALDATAAVSHQLELQKEINKLDERHSQVMQASLDLSKTIGMSEQDTADYLEKQAQIRQRMADNPLVDQSRIQMQVEEEMATRQAERQKKDQDWIGGMKSGIEEWGSTAVKESDVFKDSISGAMELGSNAIEQFAQTGKLSFRSLITDALKELDRLLIKLTMMSFADAISGKGKGSDFLGDLMGGISGAFGFAKGGVFADPSLHSYVNGVYNTPQAFQFSGRSQFAKGGVFAEAGPEAVMPLTRDANGRLGVKATGSTGGDGVVINEVNVHVAAGGGVTANATSEKQDAMGRAYANAAASGARNQIRRELEPGGLIYQEMHGHA